MFIFYPLYIKDSILVVVRVPQYENNAWWIQVSDIVWERYPWFIVAAEH
jgi:hypothetical protein